MDNNAGDAPKRTVVLCAGAAVVGHVVPMAELAESFLSHGYDATVVLIEPPIKSSDSDATFVDRIAASHPSVPFHVLPPLPSPDFAASASHPFLLVIQLLRRYNERLESFLRRSIIPRRRLHALVVDQFYVQAIDVAASLGVPAYTFVSSGASALAALIQIPALLACRRTGLKELGDTPLDLLGVPPFPASHLVTDLLEHPEDEMCRALADILRRSVGTRGVLVNTFESLESRAVQAFREPLSKPSAVVPNQVLPLIYCVGPLIAKDRRHREAAGDRRHECLAWLDAQPERSVVYLCLGSMGALPETQLREIAMGLERSTHKFLWVVRTPAGRADLKKLLERRSEPDLAALLPEGFMERTKGRGLVVKSWAPQVEVLRHAATGAFVTHCGWNSALEGVAAGVPLLCWPLYAEQRMNKVFMAAGEGVGVGVEMEGYMEGFVEAGEVEAKVRWVMDIERGREIRARVAARKREAEAAMVRGGSSKMAFAQFLLDAEGIREHLGK